MIISDLRPWLARQKFTTDLRLAQMSAHYDIAGAVDAGQPEVAWLIRRSLLLVAATLHLDDRGVQLTEGWDADFTLAEGLGPLESNIADKLWGYLREPVPTRSQVASRLEPTFVFIAEHLGQARTRPDAVEAWARDVRLLRTVASSLGLAQSGHWYLPDQDLDAFDSWYEEVLAMAAHERAELASVP